MTYGIINYCLIPTRQKNAQTQNEFVIGMKMLAIDNVLNDS